MRNLSRSTLVVLMILAASCRADFVGRCVAVADGDTISVMNGDTLVKVRLADIDCPELRQDFGLKARKFVSDLAFGKNVEVREKGLDKYGRTLGTVFVGERNLNLELVRAGLAWHYKRYSSDKDISDAEDKARADMEGFWGMNSPVPPWKFRHDSSCLSSQETKK